MSLAHFYRNVGPWGVLRGLLVTGVLFGLSVDVLRRTGDVAPATVLVVALVLPLLLRRWLVQHDEASIVVLKATGYGLVALSISAPAWNEWTRDSTTELALFVGLDAVGGLYISAWFAMMADHAMFTGRGRRSLLERPRDD